MENKKPVSCCELCSNYCLDEDTSEYVCMIDLDEDEYAKFLGSDNFSCPYFRLDDEYGTVRHQN